MHSSPIVSLGLKALLSGHAAEFTQIFAQRSIGTFDDIEGDADVVVAELDMCIQLSRRRARGRASAQAFSPALIAMLSAPSNNEEVHRASEAKIPGVLFVESALSEVLRAIRAVRRGETYADAAALRASRLRSPASPIVTPSE